MNLTKELMYRVVISLFQENEGQLAGHSHLELYSEKLTFQDSQDFIFNATKTYPDYTVAQVRVQMIDDDNDKSNDPTGHYH